MNPRDQLLAATFRIYAESGYRGTTTRRIAEEAGVNEVTLFRHFGTKDALIQAALREADRSGRPEPLGEPVEPRSELLRYAQALFEHFYRYRNLICRVMGDMVEHPSIAPVACEDPSEEHAHLTRYLERMRERGMTRPDIVPGMAAAMFVGAVLTHALWRDHFPGAPEPAVFMTSYVDLLLQAVGYERAVEERSA